MSAAGSPSPRHGITVPFDSPLHDHRRWFERLVELGYTDIWSMEVDGADGFTPLALAAAWTPALHLGIAIAPVYTRGPALLAQTAAAMADAAPGRFALGIGTSSEAIVHRWNGLPFEEPYRRARDILTFLKAALSGERVEAEYSTFSIRGFRLSRVPEQPPPVYLAALRPGMLGLAGRLADGAILNWLGPEDVTKAVAEIGGEGHKEVVARIFTIPTEDAATARMVGRRMIAAYLNVEAYAQFHRWLGRGELLSGMWERWSAGDRRGALEVIPDEVVDDLIVHGSFDECRAKIARYVENGVTIPAPMIIPVGVKLEDAVQGLSPSA
jgi:probable F420-dependent oxidoreductase